MEEDWLDVIIYLVEFTVPDNRQLNRLIIVKDYIDEAGVAKLVRERFPQIVTITNIDEWGEGIAPLYSLALEDSRLVTEIS